MRRTWESGLAAVLLSPEQDQALVSRAAVSETSYELERSATDEDDLHCEGGRERKSTEPVGQHVAGSA